MKKALLATAAVAMAAAPVLAQDGPFKDVPNDHWAYQAIDKLSQLKIIIGDPDGLYKGKRTLTRYEMAVMLARLLDILDQRYVKGPIQFPTVDTSGFATKSELNSVKGMIGQGGGGGGEAPDLSGFATKGDIAGFAKKSDIDLIRKMVAEFQTELTTLGVDVDAVKKRLKSLEDRVAVLEDQWKKRLKISGGFNTYVRGNSRDTGTSFRDKDGSVVTFGKAGGILTDTNAMHDLDLNLKANPNDAVTFEANLTVGNYLTYLGGGAGARTNPNKDQSTTLWSAHLSTAVGLPVLGNTGVTVGRIPTAFGAYTFQVPDQDSYFTNQKTDAGTLPTDGLKASFKVVGAGVTVQAGQVNPVSYGPASMNLAPVLRAGSVGGAYAGGLTRANTSGVFLNNAGAQAVTQFSAINANFNISRFNFNTSYLSFGSNAVSAAAGAANYDQVDVFGADASTRIIGLTVVGHYAKSDTRGNAGAGTTRRNKITTNNDATDISAQLGRGNFNLAGGYRTVGASFSAPGAWARVGSFQNPTDITGAYGKVSYTLSKRIELMASTQNYKGTGKLVGGLAKTDKIDNLSYGVKLNVTGPSSLVVTTESTDYTRTGSTAKPRELFTSVGYNFDFNPATSFRLLYQVADYNGKTNAAFNGLSENRQKGSVVAGQFSVKF